MVIMFSFDQTTILQTVKFFIFRKSLIEIFEQKTKDLKEPALHKLLEVRKEKELEECEQQSNCGCS